MTAHGWIAVAVCLTSLGIMALTRAPPYLVLVGGAVVLMLLEVLTPEQALHGFASEGVVTLAALFVVSAALRETGVMRLVLQYCLGSPKTARGAQLRLLLSVGPASALLNNTPLVAMLMPVVIDWGKRINVAATQLLIPLSYSAILGGLMTLIGTSTNLVVHGLLIESGREGLGLFDITSVGAACFVAGGAFLLVFGRRLLPTRGGAGTALEAIREYVLELVIEEGSALHGKQISQLGSFLPGLFIVELYRDQRLVYPLTPSQVLRANDQIVVTGDLSAAIEAQEQRGLRPATTNLFELADRREERCLVEAVVSAACRLVGQRLGDTDFRTRYGAVVIGVARQGQRLSGRLANVRILAGDVLLLEAPPAFLEQATSVREFYLASRVDGYRPPVYERAWVAAVILLGMMLVATFGITSMMLAAMTAALLMLLTRCCTEESVRGGIDWPLLVAIGASLALGRALELSGAASVFANGLMSLAAGNAMVSLALIYLIATVLSEVVTNNAAAVLVFPIAIATAETLGVDPMPFIIALMIAASASLATPIGYQTNLMVYGAGGYRFSDFARIGLPINFLLLLVTVAVAPLVWPFHP